MESMPEAIARGVRQSRLREVGGVRQSKLREWNIRVRLFFCIQAAHAVPPSPGGGGSTRATASVGVGRIFWSKHDHPPPARISAALRCFADPPPPGEGEALRRAAQTFALHRGC